VSKRDAFLILSALGLVAALAAAKAYGQGPGDSLAARLLAQGDGARLTYRRDTGRATFYSAGPGAVARLPAALAPGVSAQSTGDGFLRTYGPLFGVSDPARQLAMLGVSERDRGRSFVRYQQVYEGVPVVGGELRLQVANGAVLSASGEIAPIANLETEPALSAAEATEIALAAIGKPYGLAPTELSAGQPELWVYSPAILGAGAAAPRLVWRLEVTATRLLGLRELVLVDAQIGAIALHFNQVDGVAPINIYDNANNPTLDPAAGTFVCDANGCVGGAPADAVAALSYIGDTRDFYSAEHGRDGLDGSGGLILATVRYCPSLLECPYRNAFWDGSQIVFGQGMAVDDVVAHEMTHAVTQYESHLFYAYQSGALNEGLSDIWGELVDLTNGKGDDSAGVRWLVGEDLPLGEGPFRSMSDPRAYGQPDRMTSPDYACTDANDQLGDMGGVHTNSGVLNKAAYLIADGDSFNGYSVTGLGLDKAAAIFYELQTNLLTSASDYGDVYELLPQACYNLVGTGGIVAGDCAEVEKAVQATEMDQEPGSCPTTEAAICPVGQTCGDLFFDDLENPAAGNWLEEDPASEWYYPQNGHSYLGFDATYASSGSYNLWGYDQEWPGDYAIGMSRDVSLPAGRSAYLHFSHSYDFEWGQDFYGGAHYYDGGVVEYSLDSGLTWSDAGQLADFNGYPGALDSGTGNDLAGRSAFVGHSSGYTSSRFNLSSLAGGSVRFRFRIATDAYAGNYGWFIDDIRIYTTDTGTPTPPTSTPDPGPTAIPSPTPTPTPTPPPAATRALYMPVLYLLWAQQREPNDPLYATQWALSSVRAPEAWGVTTGANGPIIAVLDTGISLGHPDLASNLIQGWDFINDDSVPDDDQGHGTHVAGIIAAVGNNGVGVSGMAWQARVMPVKILDEYGMGDTLTAASGIYWAVDNGARVLSLSLGSTGSSPFMEQAIDYALSKGVVVIAAVGNVGGSSGVGKGTLVYPAAYAGVVGVGATDSSDQVADFSNEGSFVDVVAPGEGILSTYLDGGYVQMSGTSMATPHVSGLAGLVWTANPGLSASQVTSIITATARDMGAAGWDAAFGYGLIDAGRAVTDGPILATAGTAALPRESRLAQMAQPASTPTPGRYRRGEVLVQMETGASAEALVEMLPNRALAVQTGQEALPGVVVVTVPDGQELAALEQLRALPGVRTVSLNYLVYAM